jgi:hypothetical protein
MTELSRISFILLGLALASPVQAASGRRSTITFGHSTKLATKAARKRSFRQDIEAVNRAHEGWKKAHLNPTLYACQRNSESLAVLARRVSDRIEASKKKALAEAKGLEKTVAGAVGAEVTEIPESLPAEKAAALHAKLDRLEKAKKDAVVLERLAGQVMHFYEHDMPHESAVAGNCVRDYPAAVRRGVAASELYHADAEALSRKIEKLARIAEVAWERAAAREMVAAATP